MKVKGFTIVELLVVIFIISLISSIYLVNYRKGQKDMALLRAANKLAQDIRNTQNLAISAKECQPCGGKVPFGYGLYLEQSTNSYFIYADTYPGSPATGNGKYDSGNDVKIETFNLETGIYIKQISLSPLSVNFSPPDPKITIGGESNLTDATIILALTSDSLKTKTVYINKAGLVDVRQ